ncbi:MAG: Flp pilus assembly complex ATPase component [bacterium]|nr:Flp pilus assembly complex ATPase component [bacterium]
MMMKEQLFGEILEERFSIPTEEIDKALKFQEESGGRLGEILLNLGLVSEEQVTAALSQQFDIPDVHQVLKAHGGEEIEYGPLMNVEPVWFITNEMIPLFPAEKEKGMYFVIKDPLNLYPIEVVNGLYGDHTPRFLLADDRKYREITAQFNSKYFKQDDGEFNVNEIEKLKDLAGEAPIIKFVNSMISRAAGFRSSDIHLESHDDYLKIRYRIDGVLKDIDRVIAETASAVISRIKIMANLDIGEKRLPQDGRIQIKVAGRLFDIRVSTLPTIYGENIVMRLLEKENISYEIDTLGLMEGDKEKVSRLISHNFGLILVTGPTGSGKSTTLYSVLNGLNQEHTKIITVEDPVEYQLEGISQIQVQEQIGLSFVSVLRNILRQDPDIIMIGEIRDRETAEIAIRASLTGHLVLATLHTNDAVSAVTRLVDMGVDDYLVNSSLLGVVAQRLVRKNCPHCTGAADADDAIMNELELPRILAENRMDRCTFKKGKGCDHCAGTGYLGRSGIFEILEFSDQLKSALLEKKDYEHLNRVLAETEGGFKTLREDAILKWARGETTAEEVFRVT